MESGQARQAATRIIGDVTPVTRVTVLSPTITAPRHAAGYAVKLVTPEGEYAKNMHSIDPSKFLTRFFTNRLLPTVRAITRQRQNAQITTACIL